MSERAKHVLLMAGATVAALLMLELGLRAAHGYLGDWSNLVLRARTALGETESQRFVPDEMLGWRINAQGTALVSLRRDGSGTRGCRRSGWSPRGSPGAWSRPPGGGGAGGGRGGMA